MASPAQFHDAQPSLGLVAEELCVICFPGVSFGVARALWPWRLLASLRSDGRQGMLRAVAIDIKTRTGPTSSSLDPAGST
eukprot:15450865-Heterocapsa_arctica.AAC.1